jgi:hypothetical protein
VFFSPDSPWDPKCIDNEAAIGASHNDDSDVHVLLDQEEDQEANDSLNFEEYVDQCLLHIHSHIIVQSDNDLPPDPTLMYRAPRSILPKDPDFQALHPSFLMG